MQLTCLVALTACALSAEGYTSERHFVLRAPYEQVLARLTPEENQRKIYLACDANLHDLQHESFAYFPLRIGRRTRYCLRLPLVQTNLESIEKVEVTPDKMTIRTHLARSNWKVRCLSLKIVLTRDGDDRTRVSTYGTLQVNGLGRRLGWLLSDVTLQRLECGLRQATGKPVGE
jgi:hypothetical protein